MPHYGLNTQLNKKQFEKLKKAKELTNETTYKFLRTACMARVEEVLKEKTKNERNSESGIERRGQEALKVEY